MSASLHETEEHSSAAQTGSSSATEEQGRWYCPDTCPPYPSPDPAVYVSSASIEHCGGIPIYFMHKVMAGRLA